MAVLEAAGLKLDSSRQTWLKRTETSYVVFSLAGVLIEILA